MTYKNVLNALYQKHYKSDSFSMEGVGSSHWQKYSSLTRVRKNGEFYLLSGQGFGNFIPKKSLRAWKHLIPNLRSQSLLSQFHVHKEIKQAGFDVAIKSGREVDFDCIKQILSVDWLHKQNILKKVKSVVIVGDGYGYMTALLRILLPEARIICCNLGKILFFDVYYVEKNLPNEECCFNSVDGQSHLIFWEAENYQSLNLFAADLFVNIASMQEMDMSVIRNYFKIMRSGHGERFFYCCNRVEKALPDGSVIRFDGYPWDRNDEVIFDELCPWYQRFPVLEPPFWKSFDGPIRHRLVKLVKSSVVI